MLRKVEGAKPLQKPPSPFPLIRGRGIKVEDSSRGWGYQMKAKRVR